MMTDDYYTKVLKIAEFKYELNEDVIEAFREEIENCYDQDFTPRKTVEIIAEIINSHLTG